MGTDILMCSLGEFVNLRKDAAIVKHKSERRR